MKFFQRTSYSLTIFLFFLMVGTAVHAQNHVFFDHHEVDADIQPRVAHGQADFAMTTREGSVDFLIMNEAIYIQFSDSFMQELEEEIDREAGTDDSAFAEAIKAAVTGGVKSLLNRSMAIPLQNISEMSYENNRLIIKDIEGQEIFGELEIDDTNIVEDFRPRDARRFVSVAEKRML